MKTKTSTRSSIPDLIAPKGETAANNQEKAEVLADQYCSVFTKGRGHTDQLDPRTVQTELDEIHISREDVLKAIKHTKPDKAAGPDGIYPRILVEAKEELAQPLATLFNISLRSGTVPQAWKEAIISPIFKKGKRSDPGNYRLISLTSVVCKLLEHLVRGHITRHL